MYLCEWCCASEGSVGARACPASSLDAVEFLQSKRAPRRDVEASGSLRAQPLRAGLSGRGAGTPLISVPSPAPQHQRRRYPGLSCLSTDAILSYYVIVVVGLHRFAHINVPGFWLALLSTRARYESQLGGSLSGPTCVCPRSAVHRRCLGLAALFADSALSSQVHRLGGGGEY